MASQLMQLMRSYGVPPNEVTYSSVLAQMSKAKQVSDSLKHVHGMGLAAELVFCHSAVPHHSIGAVSGECRLNRCCIVHEGALNVVH